MKMKSALLLLALAALLSPSAVRALENHADYKAMKITECNDCHRDSNVPANHQAGWNSEHRRSAARPEKGANCAQCHGPSFCTDCHYGGGVDASLHVTNSRDGRDVMPRSHRSDFLEVHPLQAADAPASCNRCHPVSYCADCHRKFNPEKLAFASHRRGFTDLQAGAGGPRHSTFPDSACTFCHPKSVAPSPRMWSASHRQEARRNLEACQSCHPDGDVCMKCHSARTGLKVNPHPENWGSMKGRLSRAAGQRTCVKCH